jgi:alpha-amylase
MLAWPYGFAQIMSSYNFDKNNDAQGPPGSNGNTASVVINRYLTISLIIIVKFT